MDAALVRRGRRSGRGDHDVRPTRRTAAPTQLIPANAEGRQTTCVTHASSGCRLALVTTNATISWPTFSLGFPIGVFSVPGLRLSRIQVVPLRSKGQG